MVATAIDFCARCGERRDLCTCDRARQVFTQVHAQVRGAAEAIAVAPGKRSPVAAALLSLALPGLGQLYNGELAKGLIFFLGWILILPWALAVMDAYYSARVSNLEAQVEALARTAHVG